MGTIELRRSALDAVASMGVGGLALPEGISINGVFDKLRTLADEVVVRGYRATHQALLVDPSNTEFERGKRVLHGELVERGLDIPS